MADYFVIDVREEYTKVSRMSKKELGSWLQLECDADNTFVQDIDENTEMGYGHKDLLIIRGSVVVPKAEETVTVWEVEKSYIFRQ